jgi:hypothetical protein
MLRRTALGVLIALAAATLAAAVEPATAAPGSTTVGVPAGTAPGARPALTQIGTTQANATAKDHGLLVCPPPANYDPNSTAP